MNKTYSTCMKNIFLLNKNLFPMYKTASPLSVIFSQKNSRLIHKCLHIYTHICVYTYLYTSIQMLLYSFNHWNKDKIPLNKKLPGKFINYYAIKKITFKNFKLVFNLNFFLAHYLACINTIIVQMEQWISVSCQI